ncbi:uncharacterized protein LOC141605371 [Silene latifolia]|uniref:uncharacterized protein LOC141605371 n=1 Tax=Silene latifolia TaxID=37657 RepID=UPI003D76A434
MEYNNSNLGKKRGKGTSFFETIIEGADYLMDMDISNQSKKRVRVDVENSKWDESYLSFLVDLEYYWDSLFLREDDEEDDPIYALFFKNLKAYGNGYMLDVSVEHGVSSPVVYEVETDPLDLARRKAPSRNEGSSDVDRQSKSFRRYSSSRDKNQRNRLDKIKRSTPRSRRGTFISKERSFNADKELKSARKNQGFVNGVENDSLDADKRETLRTPHGYNMRKRRGLEGESQLKPGQQNSTFVCNVKTEPLDEIERTSVSLQGDRELGSGRENVGVNESDADSSEVIKKKTRRFHQDSNILNKGVRAQKVDETYESFFAGLKVVGDSMVYEYGDHRQILYEEGVEQMATDADIEAAPRPPNQNPTAPNSSSQPSVDTPPSTEPNTTPTSLSPTANHDMLNTSATVNVRDKTGKDPKKNHAKLWRQLQRILGKPFNQKEYDDLWREMTHRSEVQMYRDSRSGGSYRPGNLGKSYLDKYPDLKDEIKKVKSDPLKVLNFLRMLWFYLQNVPHEIPQPWSPKCRKMLIPDPVLP